MTYIHVSGVSLVLNVSNLKCLQFYCNELPFVYMFDLYKWKFLTSVSSIHNRFVALYNINRRVITSFSSNYGAAKSHEQMKHVCEHFFKPPPPVGTGGGYMFSGRPSVRAAVRAYVRASVRPSVHP